MLYNQTFNLDQVSFAAEGLKDAQQTVCIFCYHRFTKDYIQQNLERFKCLNVLCIFKSADDSTKVCEQGVERNDENCKDSRYRCTLLSYL